MNIYGYRLVANANSADPSFFPSLIGIDPSQAKPTRTDTYFERVEIEDVLITSLSFSRWVSYDSLPLDHRDPIMGIKSNRGAFYIPLSELQETALEQMDTDVLEMLRLVTGGRRH